MFCSKCGVEIKGAAKFCSKCGEPVKAITKEVIVKEKPIVTQTTAPQAKPSGDNALFWVVGSAIVILFLLVGAYIFLIGISLDEYYDDGTTGTIYDGGGGSTGNGCSSGYCNSNGHCCPSYAPYYCGGSCYYTSSDALQAGGAACATHKIVC